MKKLVITFDKENTKKTLYIFPFLIACILFLYKISNKLYYVIGYWAGWIAQFVLACIGLMFCMGLVFAIILILDDEPVAILDEKGITFKYFGFINWDDIIECDFYRVPGAPLEAVGIRVKNIDKISKQSTLSGKMSIFWSKIFGYPPIILSNISIENSVVINFAKQFMKKDY